MQNGFSMQAARQLGGGDQLWTTTNFSDASLFALANPRMDDNGAVVSFSLQNSVINQLQQAGQLRTDGSVYRFQPGALPTVNGVPRTLIPVK
jgi:hypothetical protein